MSRYDFLLNNNPPKKEEQPAEQVQPPAQKESKIPEAKQPKLAKEKVVQPVKHEQNLFDHSPILSRPKGFYITEKQNRDLDKGVRKLAEKAKGKVVQKIDRSTLLRLILDDIDVLDDQTVNRLYNRLIDRLVNQLTN
jgi:hypothetical protein